MANNDYDQIPSLVLKKVKKASSALFMYEFEKHTHEDIEFINEGLRSSRITARVLIDELKQAQ